MYPFEVFSQSRQRSGELGCFKCEGVMLGVGRLNMIFRIMDHSHQSADTQQVCDFEEFTSSSHAQLLSLEWRLPKPS